MHERTTLRRSTFAALLVASALGGAALATGASAAAAPAHLRTAMTELSRAAYQLSVADRDRAGHRDRALSLANEALAEVRAALAAGAE